MTEVAIALAIPADHPAYAGHFPGRPILPGVVLLDEALHVVAERQGLDAATAQIRSAKFLSPVQPGEPLVLHYSEAPKGGFRFEIRAPDRGVASGAFAFTDLGRPHAP